MHDFNVFFQLTLMLLSSRANCSHGAALHLCVRGAAYVAQHHYDGYGDEGEDQRDDAHDCCLDFSLLV